MLSKAIAMLDLLLISLCVSAQDVKTADTPALIRGGVWLPRLGGTIEDGGGKIDFETNIDLRKKETVPLLEFSLKPTDNITMSLSFFDYSVSGSGLFSGNEIFGGVAFNNGNAWTGSTDMQSVGVEAAWSVWEPYKASDVATLSFAPVAGLRWFGIDAQLDNDTTLQGVTHNNAWVAIQLGLEMEFAWDTSDTLDWADTVAIESQFLVGALLGNDGGSMWSVQAGLSVDFSPNIGGFFGYRLQELTAEDGAYKFDAGLQGLYLGGEVRF
jgi:hypothetical protein